MNSIHKLFAGIASVIVLIALVWGFVLAGSPGTERQRKFDDRRVDDLRAISQEIINIVYEGKAWREPDQKPTKPIPPTLKEVAAQAQYQQLRITDPETKESYELRVTDATHYELCATFDLPREQQYD